MLSVRVGCIDYYMGRPLPPRLGQLLANPDPSREEPVLSEGAAAARRRRRRARRARRRVAGARDRHLGRHARWAEGVRSRPRRASVFLGVRPAHEPCASQLARMFARRKTLERALEDSSLDLLSKIEDVAQAMRGEGSFGAPRAVDSLEVVDGVPLYGLHEHSRVFLRVNCRDPRTVNPLSAALAGGGLGGVPLQPHEAHVPYLLQFLVDHAVYGMGYVHLRHAYFRRPLPPERRAGRGARAPASPLDVAPSERRWSDENTPDECVLPDDDEGEARDDVNEAADEFEITTSQAAQLLSADDAPPLGPEAIGPAAAGPAGATGAGAARARAPEQQSRPRGAAHRHWAARRSPRSELEIDVPSSAVLNLSIQARTLSAGVGGTPSKTVTERRYARARARARAGGGALRTQAERQARTRGTREFRAVHSLAELWDEEAARLRERGLDPTECAVSSRRRRRTRRPRVSPASALWDSIRRLPKMTGRAP